MGKFLRTADYESFVFGEETESLGESAEEPEEKAEPDVSGPAGVLAEELFGGLPEGMDPQEFFEELSAGDFEPMIVTLEMSDGSTKKYEAMGVFLAEDRQYMALHPAGAPAEGDIPVLLLRYDQGEDDELILNQIEDDDEFEAAERAFQQMLGDTGDSGGRS